jgi:YEATS family/TIR domain
MSLSIQQSADYQGNDWWKWAVWLEGSDGELEQVRSVTYHLHSTFRDPIRTTENRNTKFKLESSGWGEFNIRIDVLFETGKAKHLQHYLTLTYPEKAGPARGRGPLKGPGPKGPAPSKGPSKKGNELKVFLSSSVADSVVASELAVNLREKNIWVDDVTSLPLGVPAEVAIRDQLRSSSAVVALISDRTPSWVSKEIEMAKSLNIPVVKVALPATNLKLEPPSFQLYETKAPRIKQLATSLADYLHGI